MPTIREHIIAGHYGDPASEFPVKMRNGEMARVYNTNHSPGWPIAGAVPHDMVKGAFTLVCWDEFGRVSNATRNFDLVAPEPRKVEYAISVEVTPTPHQAFVRTIRRTDGQPVQSGTYDFVVTIPEPWK